MNIKHEYIKFRPFFIKAKRRTIKYELELPKITKVQLVFYMLLLKLVDIKILI